MQYVLLGLALLFACTTPAKKKCLQYVDVLSVDCDRFETKCVIHFSDNSDFYIPKVLSKFVEGDRICVKREGE